MSLIKLLILVSFLRQRSMNSSLDLSIDLSLSRSIHMYFWWCKCRCLDDPQIIMAGQLSSKVEEGLLEVVVGLRGDFVVLKVLFSMEHNLFWFDGASFGIYFVTTQHHGNILHDAIEIPVPVGDVFVCDAGCDVEHNDCAGCADIVTITKTSELLLSGSVPAPEAEGSEACVEIEGGHRNAHGWFICLLEVSSHVTRDESGFTSTAVTAEDKLEAWVIRWICLSWKSHGAKSLILVIYAKV
mmetsp:Transcript_8369/g.9733  ORF Transcript_8369/g.9733 Transcript_8369/m.9733 type:complete len:241 (-) Transcript_8369:84-806(-)